MFKKQNVRVLQEILCSSSYFRTANYYGYQLVPKCVTAYFSDSVISLQDALMQCPAQDSSLSSSRVESPPSSTGETFAHVLK